MADITRDELAAAVEARAVTLVDALPAAPYGQRHLPGALNVVQEDADERVAEALPERDAAIVTYSTDAACTRGPELAERLADLGYADVRVYRDGIEDWVAAGLPVERPSAGRFRLDELATSATASLFEGHPRAGVDASIFVTRTPPGRFVDLHVHPYAEVFLLLEGRGRWTVGEAVHELEPQDMVVVPPQTPHGFRNVGDVPLLVVSVHERGTLRQDWLDRPPA